MLNETDRGIQLMELGGMEMLLVGGTGFDAGGASLEFGFSKGAVFLTLLFSLLTRPLQEPFTPLFLPFNPQFRPFRT